MSLIENLGMSSLKTTPNVIDFGHKRGISPLQYLKLVMDRRGFRFWFRLWISKAQEDMHYKEWSLRAKSKITPIPKQAPEKSF